MINHEPECPWPDEPCGHEPMHDRQPLFCVACLTECICARLRVCEQRVLAGNERCIKASTEANHRIAYRLGRDAGLDAAQDAMLKDHRPLPVIECACGWGKDCPECGEESNRVVGYACLVCCNSFGDHAYCDDDTHLHHQDGLWTGPHCPVIASIDALKEKP